MKLTAVITGGTKGIGRAICEAFALMGCRIFTCARGMESIMEMTKSFASSGYELIGHQGDLSSREEVEIFGQFVLSQCEHIDILVNNAGIFLPGNVLDEKDGNFELMMSTNLNCAYYLSRMLVPRMVENGSGHIFNICSVAGLKAYPNGGSYSISKFALNGLSKALRHELKETGVKVTAVHPGATWSNSWAGVDLPESRLMHAQDIANAIVGCYKLGASAVVEDIVIRPQLGDL